MFLQTGVFTPGNKKKLTFEVIPKGKSFALFSEDFGKKDNI